MEVTVRAFPENRIAGMYLGKAIPWPRPYPPDPKAPDWANLQREGLETLTDVVHWWIENRQIATGEFGGDWADDCEMWRWWTPLLIGFQDERIAAAQERLSAGLFALPRMKHGYSAWLFDVEHTSEDSSDTITPMLHLRPESELWQRRALRIAELMRDKWTGMNERGFLQFQSTWFSSTKVDLNPARACDTLYHPRAVQPALLHWQRTRDPELTRLFTQWMDTWTDAASRETRGKPAGILPSAIHWPDGDPGGAGKHWWKPENYLAGQGMYDWPKGMVNMTSTLLLAYHISGQRKYLDPLRTMAEIRRECAAQPTNDSRPGSREWCAARMDSFLPDTVGKYLFLTGAGQYNDLLLAAANGYVQYRVTGNMAPLDQALLANAKAFRQNFEAYTSEVRYTDRVFRFPEHYLSYYSASPPDVPDPQILYSSVTGDPGNPLYYPMNAVCWLTSSREIAALVTDCGTDRFLARLYHFGPEPRPMGAELHLLRPGVYEAVLRSADGTILKRRLDLEAFGARMMFELPPRTLCMLAIQPPNNAATSP